MRTARRAAATLGAAALTFLAACHSWKPMDIPPAPAPVMQIRQPVRVALQGGRVHELTNVVIVTDSLFGTSNDVLRVRSAFHLSQVTGLEVLRDDSRRTIGLIVLLAIVGARAGLAGF